MYIGEQRNNAPKNSPQLRAHIRVARELFYVRKRERGTQHKIGSQTQKIEREKKEKKIASLVSLSLKHDIC